MSIVPVASMTLMVLCIALITIFPRLSSPSSRYADLDQEVSLTSVLPRSSPRKLHKASQAGIAPCPA